MNQPVRVTFLKQLQPPNHVLVEEEGEGAARFQICQKQTRTIHEHPEYLMVTVV